VPAVVVVVVVVVVVLVVVVISGCRSGCRSDSAQLEKVAVAVRQGKLLATAFHPELTADLRW